MDIKKPKQLPLYFHDHDLYDAVKELANKDERSMSKTIIRIIKSHLNKGNNEANTKTSSN